MTVRKNERRCVMADTMVILCGVVGGRFWLRLPLRGTTLPAPEARSCRA
jgi:hypothetical protein